MAGLQSSFIFTDDELFYLISGLCPAACSERLRRFLFGEKPPFARFGRASLIRKELLARTIRWSRSSLSA
jgi:hypothetical protein